MRASLAARIRYDGWGKTQRERGAVELHSTSQTLVVRAKEEGRNGEEGEATMKNRAKKMAKRARNGCVCMYLGTALLWMTWITVYRTVPLVEYTFSSVRVCEEQSGVFRASDSSTDLLCSALLWRDIESDADNTQRQWTLEDVNIMGASGDLDYPWKGTLAED